MLDRGAGLAAEKRQAGGGRGHLTGRVITAAPGYRHVNAERILTPCC